MIRTFVTSTATATTTPTIIEGAPIIIDVDTTETTAAYFDEMPHADADGDHVRCQGGHWMVRIRDELACERCEM
jgi:hypothetical protein